MHVPKTIPERSLYFDYPYFAFQPPAEMRGEAPRHQAVVVGGGPVGLACALELVRHGVAVTVLEADESVSGGSRAICIARRSMEILQHLGVADDFARDGLGWTRGQSFYRDRVVFELEMAHSEDERYLPMTNLQQCLIEDLLVKRVQQVPEIGVRWQSKVTALAQDEAGVRLTVDTPEGEYDLAADWVVACDGARSSLRGLMGLTLSGTSYEGRYLIADIRLDSSYPTERRAWFDPPANPGSTVLMHKQPGNIWRVDYQLLDEGAVDEELQETRIRERIQTQLDMIGETGAWELDWYSLYKAHCLCLDDYRQGRVLFAGDAAHLVPIFGVRGLNSGFADANNLGWKLAAVIRGDAPERLLDSYNAERRPATLEIFREASKSTVFMTPPSRGYQLMRDAALSLSIGSDWPRELINPRQSAPYDYVHSALNSAGAEGAFAGGPRPGAPLSNMAVRCAGESGHLLDHLGPDFTLLHFGTPDLDPGDLRDDGEAGGRELRWLVVDGKAPAPAVMLEDIGGAARRLYDATAGTVYLARPDGHVCGRWRQADKEAIAAAIARARTGGEAAG